MIQWVYERARAARRVSEVCIATDDDRVALAAWKFGANAIMTSTDLQSGSDRVAAVADQVEGDVFVSVQGDEPMIDPMAIDVAVELVTSGRFSMSTIMTPLKTEAELLEPSVVKVIGDRFDRAIYFSRHPIPYSRGRKPAPGEAFASCRHVGIYVYDRATLMKFRSLPVSPLEKAEMLEQLRALENGISIGVREVEFTSVGVDTPEDLERVRELLKP